MIFFSLLRNPWRSILATCIILVVGAVNIALVRLFWPYRGQEYYTEHLARYSYIEHDFPPSLVLPERYRSNARLIIEETVHYQLNASTEWHSMFPSGGGVMRLGPTRRLFGVSMFHQLHCLDEIRRAIVGGPGQDEGEEHRVEDCVNYVRQMILCGASLRLEPMKHLPEGAKVDGIGLEHRCRDWTLLYQLAEENNERSFNDL